MINTQFFSKKHTINCKGKLLDLTKPKIMGILNVTEDSFFDGGKYTNMHDALKRTEQLISEGADIIDIGAASTRPGSTLITSDTEIHRIIPILNEITKHFPDIPISVDTYNSKTAIASINEGASIINDISAGEIDNDMFDTIARYQIPYILMHMQGTPENMQENPQYKNILKEISIYFAEKISILHQKGVNDIIIDPGFGFGKTLHHNYTLMKDLSYLSFLEKPLLVGISRKSMICKLLKVNPNQALNGTTALNTFALLNGAKILRVHDVKEAKQTIDIVNAIENPENIFI